MNSILSRVNRVCRLVSQANSNVTFKELTSSLRSKFNKSDIDLKIRTKRDKTLESDQFYVAAFYDAEDDKLKEIPIEVVVSHNFDPVIKFQPNQIHDILIQVYDAVTHELRHQHQSRLRNYAVYSEHVEYPYSAYLADPDELDAYALSISIELLRVMSKARAQKYMSRLTVLSKMRQGPMYVSPNLRAYVCHFDKNPLLKRLAKKVYKHLETLDKSQIFL